MQHVAVEGLSSQEIVGGRLLVVEAAEVDVLRGAGAAPEAEVERQGALEHPPVGPDRDEPREEAIERNRLAQPDQRDPGLRRVVLEALVERGAKRLRGRVPHVPLGLALSDRSMRSMTRRSAPAAARRS